METKGTKFSVDSRGMIRTARNTYAVTPIDGVLGEMHSFMGADALILRLYLQSDHKHGRTSPSTDEIAASDVHQFALIPETAERLLGILTEYLQSVRGSDEPRH